MSAFDYLEYRTKELAEEIQRRSRDPLHRVFAKHLAACAEAAIALSDALDGRGDGSETEAIRRVISPEACLSSLIEDAHEALRNLQAGLEWAGRGRPPAPKYLHGPREAD